MTAEFDEGGSSQKLGNPVKVRFTGAAGGESAADEVGLKVAADPFAAGSAGIYRLVNIGSTAR